VQIDHNLWRSPQRHHAVIASQAPSIFLRPAPRGNFVMCSTTLKHGLFLPRAKACYI
jgi:hypothetical protein